MPPAVITKAATKPKKIVFDDDGEAVEYPIKEIPDKTKVAENFKDDDDEDEENDYFAKREKLQRKRHQKSEDDSEEIQQKWFEVFPQVVLTNEDDVLDMKEKEQMDLYNLCRSSYENEKPALNKRNPGDARWLQTALHKGTAKDRANAGALLVTSNPVGNLEALTSLIGYTKLSNKASTDVIGVLTDLWMEVLLPPQRKLIAINMRGADWKQLRNDASISKEKQKHILAYWYFENELKDCYFEFLKNVQQALQTGQESNKNSAIVAATKLLCYSPEKEQMLLTMLVNKLGDPLPKVASKALHHLSEVAHRHPNMCGVIVVETEKLLFRNNISDKAQHFALCYLASIATAASAQVCAKLVNICFALFKVLVQKGAINNRTMQAILRCLQKAIAEAQTAANGTAEILNKDMQDTVYRLVHLADIRIAVQTLGLLLQLNTVKTVKTDRFYNALYKKMLDIDLTNIGTKTAAQLLHIIHRAIHMDKNIPRAKAFIKRLLQMALYMPAHIAAGCLIVIYKLLKNRRELSSLMTQNNAAIPTVEEKAEDENKETKATKVEEQKEEVNEIVEEKLEESVAIVKTECKENSKHYDAYHRVPTFAGAELTAPNELILLNEHVHPTVKLFAENLLNRKKITYYGDPLRDFGLPHFLERFAFKNPKKLQEPTAVEPTMAHKRYAPAGSRGQSVKALTKENCTEDEMYIFNYLEKKREQAAMNKVKKESKVKSERDKDDDEDEDGEGLKEADVDDDEFDDYLDGFFGKKAKKAAQAGSDDDGEDDDDDEELDFLKELGGDLSDVKNKTKQTNKKQKKTKNDDDEDEDDIDADWGDDDEAISGDEADDDIDFRLQGSDDDMSDDDEKGSIDLNNEDDDYDENDSEGSISLDEQNDDDDDDDEDDEMGSDSEAESDDEKPAVSKRKKQQKHKTSGMLNDKSFAQKLKNNKDMSSLFAAADEFAELLEETAKARGQGTTSAVFNKDKSSAKQMKWEEKRRSNTKNYTSERKRKFNVGSNSSATKSSKGKKFAKKVKF